jgi:hypothetical protein
MKNKIIFSEKKKTSILMWKRFSGLFGLSFLLMLFALTTTQCKDDDFTGEMVGVCPEVILTSPANGAINVITKKQILATFNVAMDPSSIDETSFILKKGGNLVSGVVTYSGITATFRPTQLLDANTVYSATITRAAKDPMGNVMRKDTTWSFNTGSIPEVVLTDPKEGDSDVLLNKLITADFSTAMDAASIDAGTFIVKQGANIIAGTVSYAGLKATFTPAANLIANRVYTATITTDATDIAGNAIAKDTTWSFATGVTPVIIITDPLNAAINVAINRKVNATFSKAMASSTINMATFTLKQGANVVSGLVSYEDMTATFTPTTNLLPGTEYTATITTGVKDLSNNSIAKDSTWKFTTSVLIVPVLPYVTATNPDNLDVNVVLNKVVTATFSKLMDPATINSTTFKLMHGSTPVLGFVTYTGLVATFTPSSQLLPGTVYKASITTGAKDTDGNAMATDKNWNFNTGGIPAVVLTDPAEGSADVSLNKVITADFSTAMNASSINAGTFIVKQGTNVIAGTVSYSGLKATFTPTANLTANKVYTATITKGAKDLSGNAIAKDTTWSFATGVMPIITVTDPLNAAINVAINRKVNATFSKAMASSSINMTTFTLKQGTNVVSGLVSYQNMTATFTPTTNLMPGTEYTATITTGVKDLTNNSIAKDSTWKFTTSVLIVPVLPYITATNPENLDVNIALSKSVTATFSKLMDPTTINSTTYKLMDGLSPVLGFVTYSGLVGTFTPANPLLPGTVYTVKVTTGVKDIDGNAMAIDKTWSFTTVTLPVITVTDPKNAATDIATNRNVNATFSKAMTSSTINATTFTLKQGTNAVTGLVSYQNMTATFTPATNLLPGTEYTATITTGVKDLSNNSIAKDSTWKFTTSVLIIPVLPYVISTDPDDLDTNVLLNKVITATFSKSMDPATINSNTFVLMNGLIPVSGFVSYSGLVGTFIPSSQLLPGTVYKAIITTGVKDTDGNAMATEKTWSFTTNTPIAQYTVGITIFPSNGGTTTGAGPYNSGSSVTLEAFPAAGYAFNNWTEAGLEVSNNAIYNFNINSNRNLFANFTVIISGPPGVDLGSAGDFAILAGSGVSNTGVSTIITGDVGSFPTATMNGLLSGNVNGILYTSANPLVGLAKDALTNAFNDAQGRSLNAISLPGQLGGLTLAPGLYVNSTTSGISGTGANGILTLDAGGNPNAVWIFKMGSTFITDAGTKVVLAGGAKASNIYWSVGTSATLGTNSIFYGNILADQSITLTTGATLTGRALTRIGAVTLDSNSVTKP